MPHGVSVILNAPAVFRFTAPADPARHLQAAEALGATVAGVRAADAGRVLADRITWFMERLRVPNGLAPWATPPPTSRRSSRHAAAAPRDEALARPAGPDDLAALFEDAMTAW